MENTQTIFFDDDGAHWFLNLDEQWVGPLCASEIYEKILKGAWTWGHFGWKTGMQRAQRLCTLEDFSGVVPREPGDRLMKQIRDLSTPKVKKSPVPKPPSEWFLYQRGSQTGPYSAEEVRRLLRVGKVYGRAHVWHDGMPDWKKIEEIEEFKIAAGEGITQEVEVLGEIQVEMRGSPRKPLVARIILSKDDSVVVGVCRDISVGGMQILANRIPGKAGERIRVNVSPSDQGQGLKPFAAEGMIVRVLEDGLGFSFRFEGLGSEARKAIEQYIGQQ